MAGHSIGGALFALLPSLFGAGAAGGERPAPRRVFVVPLVGSGPARARDQRAAVEEAFASLARHIEACRRHGAYAAMLPGLDLLRPYLDSRPADRGDLFRLLAAGRLATGGAYTLPASRYVGGEALVRNIVYGRLYHERMLGVVPTTYVGSDTFGSCPQLSQILAKAGFRNCVWSGASSRSPASFLHLSPDGTRLFHRHGGGRLAAKSLAELRAALHRELAAQPSVGLAAELRFVGGASGGLLPFLTTQADELLKGSPEILLGSPSAYMEAVAQQAVAPTSRVPVVSRPLGDAHPGAAVARVELKIANRLCENALLSAERFATLGSLLGARYPELALDKAWRQVLLGQRHGALSGTSSDIAYLDTLAAYREALELSTGVLRRSLRYLGRAIDTTGQPGLPIAVFNPMAWKRTDACHVSLDLRGLRTSGLALADDKGSRVAFELTRATRSENGRLEEARLLFVATDVPSLGFRIYYVSPGSDLPTAPVTEQATTATAENEFFRLTVDSALGGGIVRILDKRTDRELMRPVGGRVGNELAALRQQPGGAADARELFTSGPALFSAQRPARVEVRAGPVATSIVVTGHLGQRTRRRQVIALHRGVARIDCETELTYTGEGDLFLATFPIDLPGAARLVEERFTVLACREGRSALDYRTGASHGPSGCRIHAAGTWAGVGASVRVAFVDRQSKIVASYHLGPTTIVHADKPPARQAAAALQRTLAPRGVPCESLLDTADLKEADAPCRIVLDAAGDNACARRLLSTLDDDSRRSLTGQVQRAGHALAALRDAEVGLGQRPANVLLVLAKSADALDKALEQISESIDTAAGITLPMAANLAGIATKTPDYGLAILNNGTIGHSFEPDGRLALFLMRTARWEGQGLKRLLVPEQGTRVFRYALYPHPADWHEAAVYRAARDFNHALLPLVLDRHAGPLSSPTSFLGVEPENVVLSALKPVGHHLATGRKPDETPRGIILRLYEACGDGPCDARVRFFTPIKQAWHADLLEARSRPIEPAANEVRLRIGPAAIETVELLPEDPPGKVPPEPLDTTAEPIQPVHSRYWRHNVGAAPIGAQPLAVTIDGQPRIGQTTPLTIAVANNTDAPLSGTVWMIAPKAWELDPRRFDYRLPPHGHVVQPLKATIPAEATGGLLTALTQHRGQTYRDVAAAGTYAPLRLRVDRAAAQITARIRNPNPFVVAGQAEVITGIEAWPRSLVGPYARWAVTPRIQLFTAAAKAETTIKFTIQPAASSDPKQSFWSVVKLAYDSHVVYATEGPPPE